MAYLFNDYWEDIGTIKSFFEANLALAQQVGCSLAAVAVCLAVCNSRLQGPAGHEAETLHCMS